MTSDLPYIAHHSFKSSLIELIQWNNNYFSLNFSTAGSYCETQKTVNTKNKNIIPGMFIVVQLSRRVIKPQEETTNHKSDWHYFSQFYHHVFDWLSFAT